MNTAHHTTTPERPSFPTPAQDTEISNRLGFTYWRNLGGDWTCTACDVEFDIDMIGMFDDCGPVVECPVCGHDQHVRLGDLI